MKRMLLGASWVAVLCSLALSLSEAETPLKKLILLVREPYV
jgi:hypothetical protein